MSRLAPVEASASASAEAAAAAAAPSDKELAAAAQLSAFLGEDSAGMSELDSVRFLRARSMNIRKAARQYRQYLAWQTKENIDAILTEGPMAEEQEAALHECFQPRLLDGLDLLERPVFLLDVGRVDMGYMRQYGLTHADCLRRYVRELERLKNAVDASPHPERGQLVICDIGGCTLSKFTSTWRLFAGVATVGNAYYPEMMGCCCVVRGPSLGAWAVRSIKRVMDPISAEKIQLHSPGEPTLTALVALCGEAFGRRITEQLGGHCSAEEDSCKLTGQELDPEFLDFEGEGEEAFESAEEGDEPNEPPLRRASTVFEKAERALLVQKAIVEREPGSPGSIRLQRESIEIA